MKKLVVMMVMFLVLFATLFAKGKDSTGSLIEDDSKCLQFQIGSNFRLSSFQGSTISFKKHLSGTSAYRIGLLLSGNIEDRSDFVDYKTDSLDIRQIRDYDDLGLSISGQYLKYVPGRHTYFYYGCGPKISISKSYDKTQPEDYSTGNWQPSSPAGKSYSMTYKIGLITVAGCEVFISKSISIHSEYIQSISYQYRRSKHPSSSYTVIGKYHTFSLSGGGVLFGCSFYLK